MTIFISIVSIILIVFVSTLFHETGHFLAAKLFNYSIEEFSVGMGPKIFQKSKNGIKYSLRALPLGGFVRFPEQAQENKRDMGKPSFPKFVVLIMGVVFNILLAIIFSIIIFLIGGYNFFEAISNSIILMGNVCDSLMHSLNMLLDINNYGSLISATTITNDLISTSGSIAETAIYILTIGIALNLGVALVNLFPLPILDGGQIVINAIELIIRKNIPEKIKSAISSVCWIAVILFGLFLYVRDIMNL